MDNRVKTGVGILVGLLIISSVLILWPSPSYESLENIEGKLTQIETEEGFWKVTVQSETSINTVYFSKNHTGYLIDEVFIGDRIEIKLHKGLNRHMGYELIKSNKTIVQFPKPIDLKTKLKELGKYAFILVALCLIMIIGGKYFKNE